MDGLNALKTRRSIRKFKPDMVSDEIIKQIVDVASYSPTGRGGQSPVIIVISNPQMREKLRSENAKIAGWDENFDPFYGAPIIMLVVAKKCATDVYDGSAVITNIMNAAHMLGVGSCWIHRAKQEIDSPFGKELLKELNLTDEYIGVGHVAIGYVDGNTPSPHPRKENWVYYIK